MAARLPRSVTCVYSWVVETLRVPQQLLNDAEIGASVEHMRGE